MIKNQLQTKTQSVQSGLLEVKLKNVRSLIDRKLANSNLFIRIADQSSTTIFNLSQGQVQLQEIKMFQCCTIDNLQLQYLDYKSGDQGQLRFALRKIVEMPRVKHCIEAVMIRKIEKNKRCEPDLKVERLLQVQLEAVFLNAVQGKFTIQTIEVEMTRNTQITGEMDPFAILQLDCQKYITQNKKNQGRHCVWTEKIQFQVKNAGQSILKMRFYDKDPIKDDLICNCQVLLLKEGLLFASEKTKERQFNLFFEQKSAGIVKIQYQFEKVPFNF